MIKLFRELRMDDFFSENEKKFKKEIDSYAEQHLVTLIIEEIAGKLFEKYSIQVPTLDKPNTTSSITTSQIRGDQLPFGTSFIPGKIYEIEIANYNIPFKGDKNIFGINLPSNSGWTMNAEINYSNIVIQLTNWSKISGNNDAIEKIKNELIQVVERVEQNISLIEIEINRYNSTLRSNIQDYLSNKVVLAKSKSDSTNKLNPFR